MNEKYAATKLKYSSRAINKVVIGSETSDGAGVRLRRYIASPELDMLDPFLLMDVFRSDNPDDYIAGFPAHPHRGFETVTYLLRGNMRHRDSVGHEGVIKAGGVQWMTAGRGIVHSEMPEQEEGLLHGFQLWVNLPARDKMMPPRYQEFSPEDIPVEQREQGVNVRVVSGTTITGVNGAVKAVAASPLYLDVTLDAEKYFMEQIASGHQAFIYVIEGEMNILSTKGSDSLRAESLGVFSGDGDLVELSSKTGGRFLLVAGRPFNEPVARYGPFVMNTQAQIAEAIEDYRSAQLGHIANEK